MKTDIVLRQVNRARVALGRRPLKRIPKGKLHCPDACPLAKAVGASIGSGFADFDSPKDAYAVAQAWKQKRSIFNICAVPLPGAMARFVEKFDGGELPQYVKRARKK